MHVCGNFADYGSNDCEKMFAVEILTYVMLVGVTRKPVCVSHDLLMWPAKE